MTSQLNRAIAAFPLLGTSLSGIAAMAGALACLVASGCGGATVGGNDSETHFACSSTEQCSSRGPGWACVRGSCRLNGTSQPFVNLRDAAVPPSATAPEGGLPDASSKDASFTRDASHLDADASPHVSPPMATFNVHLVGWENAAFPRNTKLAMLWYPTYDNPFGRFDCAQGYAPGTTGQVVQPIEVRDLGGGHFAVDASDPPAEAFERGGQLAEGQFVAYADGNGNGALDFATHDRTSPDGILGTTSGRWSGTYDPGPDTIVYTITSKTLPPPPPPFPSLPPFPPNIPDPAPPGYSVYHTDYATNPSAPGTIQSAATEIPLVRSHSVGTRQQVCTNGCYNNQYQLYPDCPASPADLPKRGIWTCTPGVSGTEFQWSGTLCDGCNCINDYCFYFQQDPSDGGPPRVDLPCGSTASRIDYDPYR